jgi:uncharacterized protein YggT (Ycf19 family)
VPLAGRNDLTPYKDPNLRLVRAARAVVRFTYLVVTGVLLLLGLGFVLRLAGVGTGAAFTRWVYRNVDRVTEPFRGLFPTHPASGRSVIDISLLLAMIAYVLLGIAVHALVAWLTAQIVTQQRHWSK